MNKLEELQAACDAAAQDELDAAIVMLLMLLAVAAVAAVAALQAELKRTQEERQND